MVTQMARATHASSIAKLNVLSLLVEPLYVTSCPRGTAFLLRVIRLGSLMPLLSVAQFLTAGINSFLNPCSALFSAARLDPCLLP